MSVPVTLYRHLLKKVKRLNPGFSVKNGILTLSEKKVDELYHDYYVDYNGGIKHYLIGIYPSVHKNLIAQIKSRIRCTDENNIQELFDVYKNFNEIDRKLKLMIPKN